jgi:hypothetical protein
MASITRYVSTGFAGAVASLLEPLERELKNLEVVLDDESLRRECNAVGDVVLQGYAR